VPSTTFRRAKFEQFQAWRGNLAKAPPGNEWPPQTQLTRVVVIAVGNPRARFQEQLDGD